MDAHKLPFRNGCFDVVVSLAAIIYLDLPIFIAECYRVLNKNGILILNSPNMDIPGFRESRLSNKYYSAPELFKLLKQHNFDAELFGAFPIKSRHGGSVRLKLQQAIIGGEGKTLNLIPKGIEFKKLPNKFISCVIG